MTRRKRYITFYRIKTKYCIPYPDTYGMCCTRTWWQCFKIGLRHLQQGSALFFTVEKASPKTHLFFL